jgi:hypothetical protein
VDNKKAIKWIKCLIFIGFPFMLALFFMSLNVMFDNEIFFNVALLQFPIYGFIMAIFAEKIVDGWIFKKT